MARGTVEGPTGPGWVLGRGNRVAQLRVAPCGVLRMAAAAKTRDLPRYGSPRLVAAAARVHLGAGVATAPPGVALRAPRGPQVVTGGAGLSRRRVEERPSGRRGHAERHRLTRRLHDHPGPRRPKPRRPRMVDAFGPGRRGQRAPVDQDLGGSRRPHHDPHPLATRIVAVRRPEDRRRRRCAQRRGGHNNRREKPEPPPHAASSKPWGPPPRRAAKASAARTPSTAALTIPPAYPAPSPRG